MVEVRFVWDNNYMYALLGKVTFTCYALAFYLRVGQNLRMDPKVCNNLYSLKVERKACCKSTFFLIFILSLISYQSPTYLPRLDNLNAN
jgi:hypothetical protein